MPHTEHPNLPSFPPVGPLCDPTHNTASDRIRAGDIPPQEAAICLQHPENTIIWKAFPHAFGSLSTDGKSPPSGD